MRWRWYRTKRFLEEHAIEINMGIVAFSIAMIVKSEVQWKMMRKDIYVNVTADDLTALLRNDVPTMSYDLDNNYHIHLVKVAKYALKQDQ